MNQKDTILTKAYIDGLIKKVTYHEFEEAGKSFITCGIWTSERCVVMEKPAMNMYPGTHDPEKGRKAAYNSSYNKLWELEAYRVLMNSDLTPTLVGNQKEHPIKTLTDGVEFTPIQFSKELWVAANIFMSGYFSDMITHSDKNNVLFRFVKEYEWWTPLYLDLQTKFPHEMLQEGWALHIGFHTDIYKVEKRRLEDKEIQNGVEQLAEHLTELFRRDFPGEHVINLQYLADPNAEITQKDLIARIDAWYLNILDNQISIFIGTLSAKEAIEKEAAKVMGVADGHVSCSFESAHQGRMERLIERPERKAVQLCVVNNPLWKAMFPTFSKPIKGGVYLDHKNYEMKICDGVQVCKLDYFSFERIYGFSAELDGSHFYDQMVINLRGKVDSPAETASLMIKDLNVPLPTPSDFLLDVVNNRVGLRKNPYAKKEKMEKVFSDWLTGGDYSPTGFWIRTSRGATILTEEFEERYAWFIRTHHDKRTDLKSLIHLFILFFRCKPENVIFGRNVL